MSYVEQYLMEGETVVQRAKLPWIEYLGSGALILLGAVLALLGVSNPDGAGILFWIGVIVLVFGAGQALYTLIVRGATEVVLTNKRLVVKVGLIQRTSTELLLTKVESMLLHQSMLGRLLDFGQLVVQGTGGTQTPLPTISAPMRFRTQVQQELDRAQAAAR